MLCLIVQLSYIARPVSVDDILLLLSMSGEVIYELSIIMSSSNYVATHTGSHQFHGPSIQPAITQSVTMSGYW